MKILAIQNEKCKSKNINLKTHSQKYKKKKKKMQNQKHKISSSFICTVFLMCLHLDLQYFAFVFTFFFCVICDIDFNNRNRIYPHTKKEDMLTFKTQKQKLYRNIRAKSINVKAYRPYGMKILYNALKILFLYELVKQC